jgi:hypothetical protein
MDHSVNQSEFSEEREEEANGDDKEIDRQVC